MEGFGLGIFMLSAGVFSVLFDYSGSPLSDLFPPFVRRAWIGLAMGVTAVGIIYSPWGKQSGAHLNPAVTLTFFRLGKISKADAFFYILFQTIGGTLGVLVAGLLLQYSFRNKPVNYVTTVPGEFGIIMAFIAEIVISFLLMITVLVFSNKENYAKYTGIAAGTLVFLFITFEAPFSGMSINPARSIASALPSGIWTSFWIYMTAPILGMLGASEVYGFLKKGKKVMCAKLHHHNDKRCIFVNCGYKERMDKQKKENI